MDYLEELFYDDLSKQLGGSSKLIIFGKEIIIDDIFPPDSELRENLFLNWKIYKGELFSERLDQISKLGENRQRISELSNFYNTGLLIPFVGAGMSIPSNLMGWLDLLNDLGVRVTQPRILAEINRLISLKKFEDAADEIYKRLKSGLFNELLENRYRVLKYSEIHGPIKIITSMFKCKIVTTNFDNIIETILQNYQKDVQIINGMELKDYDLKEVYDNLTLIKIHGDFRQPKTRILLKAEYDIAYKNSKFKKIIKDMASQNSLLFLGCSLSKDRYLDTIKSPQSTQRHYAIVKTPMKHEERGYYNWIDREGVRLSRYGIFPIWIEEYSDVDVVLFTLMKLYAEEVSAL